jgi:hypothetical protein
MCLKSCSACDGVVEDDNIFVSEASTTLSKGYQTSDLDWRLARARKIARHAVHEVGPQAVEVVQVFLDGLNRHLGAPLAKLLGPDILAGVVHIVRVLRPMPGAVGRVPSASSRTDRRCSSP